MPPTIQSVLRVLEQRPGACTANCAPVLPRAYGGDCRRLKRQSHASASSRLPVRSALRKLLGAEHRAVINRPRPSTERRRRPLEF
jgi:hypothetical protein